MLLRGVTKLGLQCSTERERGLVKDVYCSDSSIRFVKPWRISRVLTKPLFIDEAAGVGIARIRRWYRRIGKLVATTTIHGYEGSGRLSLKISREYFKRSTMIKLVNPVRYYPGDPLERFLYKVFHLDVEHPTKKQVKEPLVYSEISVEQLVDDYILPRKVYGLPFLAHYRNEPDDLVLLLDSGLFKIRALVDSDNDIVAVVQIREESALQKSLDDLSRKGYRVLDKLIKFGIFREILGSRTWRIARIAVLPSLQRKGLGSRILKFVEEEATRNEVDAVTAIFSGFSTIKFLLKNAYTPVYTSPRYDRTTDEKTLS